MIIFYALLLLFNSVRGTDLSSLCGSGTDPDPRLYVAVPTSDPNHPIAHLRQLNVPTLKFKITKWKRAKWGKAYAAERSFEYVDADTAAQDPALLTTRAFNHTVIRTKNGIKILPPPPCNGSNDQKQAVSSTNHAQQSLMSSVAPVLNNNADALLNQSPVHAPHQQVLEIINPEWTWITYLCWMCRNNDDRDED